MLISNNRPQIKVSNVFLDEKLLYHPCYLTQGPRLLSINIGCLESHITVVKGRYKNVKMNSVFFKMMDLNAKYFMSRVNLFKPYHSIFNKKQQWI